MVYRENVQRYFDPFDHSGPIYLYTYVIFALMAPWCVLLPAALVNLHGAQWIATRRRGARRIRSDRFTMIVFLGDFRFLYAVGFAPQLLPSADSSRRRDHGRAPARSTIRADDEARADADQVRLRRNRGRDRTRDAGVHSAGAVPARAVVATAARPETLESSQSAGSDRSPQSSTRCGTSQPDASASAIGAIAWLFMFYFFVFAMPAGDAFRSEKPFAAAGPNVIGNDPAGLAFFRNQGPIFYLGLPQPVPQYDKLIDLNRAVSERSRALADRATARPRR